MRVQSNTGLCIQTLSNPSSRCKLQRRPCARYSTFGRSRLASSGALGTDAVVLGGSIAGLTAARILSDHFETVYVIDKDPLPDTPIPRQGCLQGRHIHVLLPAGLYVYEEIYPGFSKDLEAAGAVSIDWQTEYAYNMDGRWSALCTAPQGLSFPPSPLPRGGKHYTATRPLIESVVRKRTSQLSNVKLITNAFATSLLSASTADGKAVGGVTYINKDTKEVHELPVALVVDASGRSSQSAEWLSQIGFDAPVKEVVTDAKVKYSDMVIRPPPEIMQQLGVKCFRIEDGPKSGDRSAIFAAFENGLAGVLLAAYGDTPAPTTREEWMNFAKQLPDPFLYNLLQRSELITQQPAVFKGTSNQWRHFETMAVQPAGFLAVGDAVMAPNPVYGQGMTFAILGAATLRDVLSAYAASNSNGPTFTSENPVAAALCHDAQQKMVTTIRPHFEFAATADKARIPGAKQKSAKGGFEGALMSLVDAYFDIYMSQLIFTEKDAAYRFLTVALYLAPVSELMTPRLIGLALLWSIKQRMASLLNGGAPNKVMSNAAAP